MATTDDLDGILGVLMRTFSTVSVSAVYFWKSFTHIPTYGWMTNKVLSRTLWLGYWDTGLKVDVFLRWQIRYVLPE